LMLSSLLTICTQTCGHILSIMAPMEVDGQTSPSGLFAQCSFAIVRNGTLDDEMVAQRASWT
jgi:hypothetical protein